MTIIETSANELYSVIEAGPDLEHVWWGVAMKRAGKRFVPKKSARMILVRKLGSRVVAVDVVA